MDKSFPSEIDVFPNFWEIKGLINGLINERIKLFLISWNITFPLIVSWILLFDVS